MAALEILLPDYAVRNLIRQRKLEQIYSVMQTGTTRGMQTMEQALCDLVLRGTVSREVALDSSSYPDQLVGLLERSGAARRTGRRSHPPRTPPDSGWRGADMGKHDETSIWKKEISFRKKPKQAPKAEPVWPQEAAHAASAAPDAKSSVWKKEIGFGRKGKPKPPKPVSLPPVEAPPLPPAAATDPDAKGSVWRKEISFGRKAKPEASAAEAPAQPAEEAKTSV